MNSFLEAVEGRAYYMARLGTRNDADALDIMQDSMTRFVERYSGKPTEEWKPLFYRVLHNRIADWRRREFIRSGLSLFSEALRMNRDESAHEAVHDPPDPKGASAEDAATANMFIKALGSVLPRLSLRQRQTFLMRAWEGLRNSLAPEERQVLAPHESRWDSLDAQQQERLLQGSRVWRSMTPEQRTRAQERFRAWQAMTPEERRMTRQRFERFQTLPAAKRESLLGAWEKFQKLSPDQQNKLQKKWKNLAPDERSRTLEQTIRQTAGSAGTGYSGGMAGGNGGGRGSDTGGGGHGGGGGGGNGGGSQGGKGAGRGRN